ncbi:gliding motility-associated C-terminal domain-containing protein [Flavobacterium ginsengisoli]|uniref:gliding motility-associated C-terminal domain-containing protein n=1 Tax=Flavobacterium ginsengisoli TaxID=871694 RepID=UPI0024157332|nr:gliding motility-associated C-terminal domain-containing protein [Flavobacterium ginsengisoli]
MLALENLISNVETIDVKPNVTTTYYVTVEGDGVCALPPPAKEVTVNVNQLPVATISYSNSVYCNRGSAAVTLTGTVGGTFNSDAGLTIDVATGEINLASSTVGMHTISYVFSDGTCSNTVSTDITINATVLPAALPDIIEECSASPAVPTLTDLCAGIITATTPTSFPITTQGITEVTWTFDYGGGFTQTVIQTVNIKDITKPAKPILDPVTAECEVVSIAPPTTTDNCAGTVTGTTLAGFPITAQGTTEVTWTFDDGNGNIETAVQEVVIKDITKPAKPVLDPVTAECEVASIAPPTTTDNCAGTVTGTTLANFPITAQGTTEVTWTFDDGNGNIETAIQEVVIKDTTKPAKPVLDPVAAECEAASIIPPTTTDNCAGTVTGTTLAGFPITAQGTTEVTWTFDDGNGNVETAVQQVVIKDTTKPAKPVLDPVAAECEVATITAPTTTDNCAGTVMGTTLTGFPITAQGTTEVTWTFDDGNGNIETAIQEVVIKDITKPVAPILNPVTAECEVATITPPIATDNCKGLVMGTTLTSFPITAQGTTEVTWTFDDGNGNIETAVQEVVIKDITKPAKPVLDPVTAECEVASITPPTTTDNCAGTVTGTTLAGFPITTQGTTEVTWTFDDGNGNIETAVQEVIIKDITKPAKPVLDPVTAECEVATIAPPTTTDNCAGTIAGTTLTSFPITAQGTTEVTWTFDDGNGNIETAIQEVVIKDITKPAKPILDPVTAECEVASIAPPTTIDNCAGTIAGTTLAGFPITAQGTTEVTWTFDDGNGNIETAVQEVVIKDITKPAKPVLDPVTAECEVASITPPTTTDNCAGTVTGTTLTSFPITAQGTTEVTWTFDDGNGNVETAVQQVVIKDTTKPAKPVLDPVAAECEVASITPPTTTDNCAGTVTGTTLTSFPIAAQGTTEVTWTFDDGNGNIETAVQNVIIKDVTAPVAPVLVDITDQCSVTLEAPTAVDNCAGIITGTTTTTFPVTEEGTTLVIWTFNDGNGNISTAEQKIVINTIVLEEPEKATCLTNKPEYVVTLSVSGKAPFTVVGTGAPGTWSGNNWTSNVISGGTDYNVNIQDQYKCNTLNVAGVSPNCCVFDVVCPTFPAQTVSCADELPTATSLTIAQFQALGNRNGKITNNCGIIDITAENSQNQGCNTNVVRTYTITEYADDNNNGIHDAGENTILNSSKCTEVITVNDRTAPVFTEALPPAVINADCDTIPDPVILTATDNCSIATVTYNEEKTDGDCSGRYSLERTWTAVDECGNKNVFSQKVNVSCMETIYNALSPNGDGINDTFVIKNIDCFPNNTVEIYNRYGVLIYSKKGYDNITDPFDGFSSGRATVLKKDMIPTGTYFYILEYENNGKQIKKSGYLYVSTQ